MERQLCLSTKFPQHEIRWNYGILRSGYSSKEYLTCGAGAQNHVKLSPFYHFCKGFFFGICVDTILFRVWIDLVCFRNSQFLNAISVICCYSKIRCTLLFSKAAGCWRDVWVFELATDIFLLCNVDGFLVFFFRVINIFTLTYLISKSLPILLCFNDNSCLRK